MSEWTMTGHEWTPASEPPPKGARVLVVMSSGEQWVVTWRPPCWPTDTVTHWRHLPPPPKQPTRITVTGSGGVVCEYETTSTVTHETTPGGGWCDDRGREGHYIRHTLTWEEER